MCALPRVKQRAGQNVLCSAGTQPAALWRPKWGWDGEAQEGGDICAHIADSLYHAAEAQFKIKYNPLPPQQETWKK